MKSFSVSRHLFYQGVQVYRLGGGEAKVKLEALVFCFGPAGPIQI
jgi:hypothetical protein